MLYTTQFASQYSNPFVINALTRIHGLLVSVYNKSEANEYDEGRDSYISNSGKYNVSPLYYKKKLLIIGPVKETYASGNESFDSYMEDTYILTCDKNLVFVPEQKFEVFYDKYSEIPQRVFQSFEVKEFSNSHNQWSIRKVMLKPFN